MAKALYVVHSRPSSPEREEEYNKWYDEVHLPDVRAVPGIVGASRYKLAGDPSTSALPEYLAIYDIDCDDPQDAVDGIMAGVEAGRITLSDALQLDPMPVIGLYLQR
jgi:hypothetical protein